MPHNAIKTDELHKLAVEQAKKNDIVDWNRYSIFIQAFKLGFSFGAMNQDLVWKDAVEALPERIIATLRVEIEKQKQQQLIQHLANSSIVEKVR